MEVFVRTAKTKYTKPEKFPSYAKCLKKFLDQYLTQCISKFDCHAWRAEKLWTMDCDLAIKRGYFTLKQAYMKNIGEKATPGSIKYMSHVEFQTLISQADVYTENFTQNQVTLCYNLSMSSQVDELNAEKHANMDFTEFIEAFARVAD